LKPYEFVLESYTVKVYPPLLAEIDHAAVDPAAGMSLGEIFERLQPAAPQRPSAVFSIDDCPTIAANLIQIDFRKETFDRRAVQTESLEEFRRRGDPPPLLALQIANDLIVRIRSLTRAPHL